MFSNLLPCAVLFVYFYLCYVELFIVLFIEEFEGPKGQIFIWIIYYEQ